jgi:hypothetical protein
MRRLLALCLALVPGPPAPAAPDYSKVLVIVEENHTYGQIIGAVDTPYLTAVARSYGSATRMTANYPVGCPSLAA